ncbi:Uncharacterized protein ESCO_005261 [Escovopsis weberi]|uniref:LysM domain-containing protein n=1 Tax=Escovopsis weberi TaxID=150374 RepID=A0A0M8N7E2_ESCWE|nr:Uncharacterized protein ESCO_005261 [Escovopsis weberi]
MADPDHYHDRSPSSSSSRLSSRPSSTAVKPASQSTDLSSVRSRGRRQASSIRNGSRYDDNDDDDNHNDALDKGKDNGGSNSNNSNNSIRTSSRIITSKSVRDQERMHPIRNRVSGLLTASHPLESPTGSRASSRGAGVSPNRDAGAAGGLGQFLGDSLSQSWSSVQGLAASLIAAGEEQIGAVGRSQAKNWSPSPKFNRWAWDRPTSDKDAGNKASGSWGPAPPAPPGPGIADVAVGSSSEREAALKTARTASVLESHQGVNGGLDITGNYKRRTSDEMTPASAAAPPPEEYLVYIHTVQPSDTYAGLILRYKCRGDAFKKANGLWSNDTIVEDPLSLDTPSESVMSETDKDRPWTHVKWKCHGDVVYLSFHAATELRDCQS